MGTVWATLYVLGFVLPGAILVGSSVAVVRLARRLASLGTSTRPAWHFVALHLGLIVGLALPLGPLAALTWLVVPVYLYRTVRRVEGPGARRRLAGYPFTSVHATRRSPALAAFFVATGVLLPWATGLGVKLYLDAHGRPTLPLEGFLDPASVAIELLLTLGAWAFPFLLLASAVALPWRVGFTADSPHRDALLPIWLAYGGGVAAGVPVFASVFWQFDTLMLLVPVGLVLIPPMALGYAVGWWLLRRRP